MLSAATWCIMCEFVVLFSNAFSTSIIDYDPISPIVFSITTNYHQVQPHPPVTVITAARCIGYPLTGVGDGGQVIIIWGWCHHSSDGIGDHSTMVRLYQYSFIFI